MLAVAVRSVKTNDLPVGLEFLGRAYSEPTLLKLAYGFEQGTMVRRPPASTPPLEGETITVPEPGNVAALAFLGMTIIGWKRQQQQRKRRN